MMHHSLDFFRDEIRNGFYIPTAVKASWAVALDVLSEIDRICQKHDITYFADWGTFLGAVRHAGIVPWDDDIDICMKRDDYEKFRSVADSELPSAYVIHDFERQDEHWLFLSRVVNNSRISFDEDYLNSHYNHPWLAGVDIFVKDYLFPDESDEKKRCDDIMFILAVAEGPISGEPVTQSRIDNLRLLEKKYNVSLLNIKDNKDLAIALYKLAEKQMTLVPREKAKEIGQIFPWILKGIPGEPREFYEETTWLPFEDTMIPVPSRFNRTLEKKYRNYNEIHKVWSGHDYPAFDNQRKLFEKMTGGKVHKFEFDSSFTIRPEVDSSASLKTLAKETLEELNSMYNKLQRPITSDSSEESPETLGAMQQLAIDLGTLIESVRGENDSHAQAIVKVLEELCESIFNAHQGMAEGSSTALIKIADTLKDLSDALDKHLLDRKEILLLPTGHREWKCFDAIYTKVSADPQNDVVIVPLPYMFKDCYGRITSTEDEIAGSIGYEFYPKELTLTAWDMYDISLHCPDKIFIQDSYDNENICLTIPPYYYAGNLRQYSPELIHIPIGLTSEFTKADVIDRLAMNFYVTMPGITFSDKVFVQSENIKAQYADKLTEWAGENTRQYWERKIIARDDLFANEPHDCAGASEGKTGKKKMLYCISSYEYYEHRDRFVEAIKMRLSIFKENKDSLDVSLCLYPQVSCRSSDTEFFDVMSELASSEHIDIMPYEIADTESIALAHDAYYGSSSPLVPVFVADKKPVMLANYDI